MARYLSFLGRSHPMSGITGLLYVPKVILYFQGKFFNCWLATAFVLLSMLGGVEAQAPAFEGPVLSSRRLQNITEVDGNAPPAVAGIFSNSFGQSCRSDYLKILAATDSFDQLGSSAATTVMTLIPAMITFASIPMASISSLKFLNTQLALFTGALTLGLGIEVKSTLDKKKEIRVEELCDADRVNCKGEKDLHGMYDSDKYRLSELHKSVEEKRLPIISIIIIIACYSSLQVILFGTLVRALPKIENILFIWACPEQSALIYNAWLGVTAVFAAILRTLNVSSFLNKHDEVLHISPLPGNRLSTYCQHCSAMTRDPRARPPFRHRLKNAFTVSFFDIFSLGYGILNITSALSVYLRPHPMIVVLRRSHSSTPQSTLTLAIHGFIQAISIVLLTFMFASMWGGSVMWTTLFVIAFMSIIWVSRTASLVVGGFLERKTGMTIIYFDTDKERTAILRLLAAMPQALVEITHSGFIYWDGHNLNDDCKSHEVPELERSEKSEIRARSLGLLRGIVVGFVLGVGVFFSFFVATLPYNVPFIPRPHTWVDYPVAVVVSACIAGAFWADFAFQRSRILLWGYFYDKIGELGNAGSDVEAIAGRASPPGASPVLTQQNVASDELKLPDPEITEIRS